MAHYICTGGCHGVAEKESVCGAQACVREHMPMVVCSCTDGMHKEVYDQSAEKAPETSP